MSYPCPRCTKSLDETELFGVEILRCPDGCGLIVEQRCMIPLTTAIARDSLDCIDPHLAIPHAPHDPDQKAVCPGCRGPMQTFGYLESRYAHLDRCSACAVVWIDHDELETVVRLNARNLGQAHRHAADRRELARHLSKLVWIGADQVMPFRDS